MKAGRKEWKEITKLSRSKKVIMELRKSQRKEERRKKGSRELVRNNGRNKI